MPVKVPHAGALQKNTYEIGNKKMLRSWGVKTARHFRPVPYGGDTGSGCEKAEAALRKKVFAFTANFLLKSRLELQSTKGRALFTRISSFAMVDQTRLSAGGFGL